MFPNDQMRHSKKSARTNEIRWMSKFCNSIACGVLSAIVGQNHDEFVQKAL
jgi:hypothetical protein